MIDGMLVDEFIARNADDLWLHQIEMWELMSVADEVQVSEGLASSPQSQDASSSSWDEIEITDTPEFKRTYPRGQVSDEVPF